MGITLTVIIRRGMALVTVLVSGLLLFQSNQPFATYRTPATSHINNKVPDPDEVLRLVNKERSLRKLNELTKDPGLTLVAKNRAEDMAINRYYAHINPAGEYFYDYFKRYGFSTGFSCENLELDFTANEPQYINDWLASKKGHKACMLNKEVTKAGYATAVFEDLNEDGSTVKLYVIVGIHAGPPFETLDPSFAL